MYLQARFSACTHSNSLSIWAKSDHNLERRFGGSELSRSWSKASWRIASDPILFGERVRRMDSRLALIFMLPACGLFMAGRQVGNGTKQIYPWQAIKMKRANFQDLVMVSRSEPLTKRSARKQGKQEPQWLLLIKSRGLRATSPKQARSYVCPSQRWLKTIKLQAKPILLMWPLPRVQQTTLEVWLRNQRT